MEEKKNGSVGAALVVGGGIAGIQASLDLAEAGIKVYLVEKGPAIGGKMAQLDKTFPTNDCAMCILSPKLVGLSQHPNISLLTHSQVEKVSGSPGNFRVQILQRARLVDADKCTGCGICWQKCPEEIPSEFNMGLGPRKAIYIPYPQAVPLVPVIDTPHCRYIKHLEAQKVGRKLPPCRICEKLCPAGAIDWGQQDQLLTQRVGAIILATGYEIYDARLSEEFGFGRYPNVVTALQMERLLSAAGPTAGHVTRPSDHREPRKIAFLQCVGSRDQNHGYCSAVCCMYATKEAMLAQEHLPGVECAIFQMDMRAFGKGFDAYFERGRRQGIRYIRCRPSSLKEVPASKSIIVRYQTEEGQIREEEFDLVVLSVGLESSPAGQELARSLGVELDSRG